MRKVVLLLVGIGLLAGCVHAKDPTVQVNALQSDIVFGLKPTTTVGPAPGASPIVSAPPATVQLTVPSVPIFPVIPILPPETHSDCPAAALDAFPDVTAPVGVTTTPPVGAYKWELGGQQVSGPEIVPVTGTAKRLIRRVTPIAHVATDNADSQDFTFQMLEPYDAHGDVLAITYQVRTDNTAQHFVQPATGANVSAFATTPDAGMSIVREDVLNSSGNVTPLFQPAAPLLVMPLPVTQGAQFLSVAVDPVTGDVTTLQATEIRRARIDACGTIIEGWEVSGLERTVSSATAGSTASATPATTAVVFTDNVYATQAGAMMIAEHSVEQLGGNSFGTVDDAIGQQKPSPLPQGAA